MPQMSVEVLMSVPEVVFQHVGCLEHLFFHVTDPVSGGFNPTLNSLYAPYWHVVCPAVVVSVDPRRRSTHVLPVMPTPAGEIRTLTKTWLQIPNHLDTYSKGVGRR